MTLKEKVWVGVGGLLVYNLSIFLTLYLSGFFGESQEVDGPSKEDVEAQMAINAEIADKYRYQPEAPQDLIEESHRGYVKSIADAMYICGEKVDGSIHSPKSYSFNSDASTYDDAEGIYKIFIDLETASTATQERKVWEVTCEVSAATKNISNYKMMDK